MNPAKNKDSKRHDMVVTNVVLLEEKKVEDMEFFHQRQYTRLIEHHVTGEANGWTYSLSLEDYYFRFWKPLGDDMFEVDYIELAAIDNKGYVKEYVESIVIDGKEVFNMNDYQFKTFLRYDEEDNDYYLCDFLAPKEPLSAFPNETQDVVSKLREAGCLVDTDEIMKHALKIANEHYDGHFTLMKFTTDWKCSFRTPGDWFDIQEMHTGKTQDHAMLLAIDRHYYDLEVNNK